MYVYIQTESQLWTVGFYAPDGEWHSDSDHSSKESAAKRVHYLNGEKRNQSEFIQVINYLINTSQVTHVKMEDKDTAVFFLAVMGGPLNEQVCLTATGVDAKQISDLLLKPDQS